MIRYFDGGDAFLSNFFPGPVEFEGLTYPSTEHAYQAAKTFDPIIRKTMSKIHSPAEVKKHGQHIDLRHDWEGVKFEVMEELVRKKFQIPELRLKLRQTKLQMLVEGNLWHDNIWGDCTCAQCRHFDGENHLGRILMEIRHEIKRELLDK